MAGSPNRRFDCLSQLGVNEGAALLRGFTIAEENGYMRFAGSPTLIPFALESFRRHHDELTWTAVADWMIEYSTNPWVPFGFRKSRSDWEFCKTEGMSPSEVWNAAKRYRRSLEHQHEERQKTDRIRAVERRKRRKSDHERRVSDYRERSRIRRELITRAEQLSLAGRLALIANDHSNSVTFYPTEFASVDDKTIQELSASTRLALIERLADRRNDPWKMLVDRLKAAD